MLIESIIPSFVECIAIQINALLLSSGFDCLNFVCSFFWGGGRLENQTLRIHRRICLHCTHIYPVNSQYPISILCLFCKMSNHIVYASTLRIWFSWFIHPFPRMLCKIIVHTKCWCGCFGYGKTVHITMKTQPSTQPPQRLCIRCVCAMILVSGRCTQIWRMIRYKMNKQTIPVELLKWSAS